ncbi:cholesterol transporter ABCA5-like isoform X2 [Oculina patagonica]
MAILQQTKYLIVKNFHIKKRNKRETLQEILIPIWWILLLLVIKLGVRTKELPAVKESEIPTINVSTLGLSNSAPQGNATEKPTIGYVINEVPNAVRVMELVQNASTGVVNYLEFNSTDSMLEHYRKHGESKGLQIGIEFAKGKKTAVAYTIRLPVAVIPSTKNKLVGQGKCHNASKFSDPGDCPANSYIIVKVATLQASIDAAITKIEANLPYYIVPNIQAKMMPKEAFTPSLQGFSYTVLIYIVMAFAPYLTILLVNLVQEKETKLKELMRIMGTSDVAYWLSWAITYAVIMLFAVLVMNAITVPGGIFGGSNYLVMVIICYLYGLTIITMAFMFTPFFKNARSAGLFASLGTTIFGAIAIPLIAIDVPNAVKWVVALFSPTAFGLAISQAVDVEGLHFHNLTTKGTFPAINLIIMLIVDAILYFLLALYFDAVIPAEYGPRKPPHFIFMPSFWKSLFSAKGTKKAPARQMSARVQEASDDIEAMPADMHGSEVISIHKLRKVFHGKEDVVAVNGVSMDIYEGHVTALLGHNGAGKTTLISIMTGMVPATEGNATVYGMDITDPIQMQEIRKVIGVCQQQNVLFNFMTVREHLEFYAGLKEVAIEEREEMVSSLMKEIDLADQKDTLSKDLSGGQKRKLCVGMALIGDPKVVILDEPTSGMDPYSRRLLWSLLKEKCKNRVVLLTTHFMDEADILADYKAILSKGKVRCAGSSLFLKNRFGIGYHLNMALADDCDTERLTELVQSKVQGAQAIRHHGKEMAFALPMEQVSYFPDLLKALEDNNDSSEVCAAPLLGVTSYGVAMTTLEEVFLQLEDTSEVESESSSDDLEPQMDKSSQSLLAPTDAINIEDGGSRYAGSVNALHKAGVELNNPELKDNSQKPVWKAKQQLLALLKIRWLMSIRTPAKIFFQIIVPPCLLIAGLSILRANKDSTKTAARPEPLHLAPDLYLKPGSDEDYATNALLQNSTNRAMDYVMGYLTEYGVGTTLVSSINDMLSSSSRALQTLGFNIREFPAAFNLSQPSDLSSSFEMRYNDTTVHSVPLGVNILGSILHMNALKSQNKTPYPLETTILPFPGLKPEWTFDSTAYTSILLLGLALIVIPGGFGILVVGERQEKIRHLLRVSGVSSFVYWLEIFLADAIVFLIPMVLMLILVPAFQLPSLSPPPAMGCLVLALFLYLPSGILFSYLLSFLFSSWEVAQQVLPMAFTFVAMIPFMAVSLVDMIASRDTAIILHYVFVFLLPPYPVFGALYYIDSIYRYQSAIAFFTANGNSVDVQVTASHYFTWTKYNGIPAALIAPVVHSILFAVLIYILDQRNVAGTATCTCTRSKNNIQAVRSSSLGRTDSVRSPEPGDEDVRREKEKLLSRNETSIEEPSYSVIIKGLWKRFGSGKTAKTVVKDLFFGVERGEVFGLLGPNGAGKTTSLNMVTGDLPPTRGKVYVAGYDMSRQPHEAFQHMGFCPQADALWNIVTLQEHLEAFARIRGVPWGEVQRLVEHYMSALRITEHAKKRSKDLSGGTKRKVSFAMAMLGDPELLLLDEPSTGMDPSARRFLWNTISKNVHGNRGAILTTHSMEEADALCSRVGIMVKGQLKCLGSTQHLKSTYGSGYTLEIKLTQTQTPESSTEDSMERLHSYVVELLPGATRSEMFGGRVIYKVPREGVGALSVIFNKLERGKEEIGIEEYSFSQSTLEQVFLEFAREQDDDRTGAKDNPDDVMENGGDHVPV